MFSTRFIISSRRSRLSPSMAANVLFLSTTVTLLLLGVIHRSSADAAVQSASPTTAEEVDIDLLNGIVKGYSQYIQFVAAPVPTKDRDCTAQAVLRVDVGGPFSRVRLTLDYDRPRLWTLDVSDSADADGYGSPGVDGLESSMTEIQLFNSQLRIYGNSLPGHRDASVDGGHLLKVADGVVDRKHNRLVLDVAAERVEWRGHANGAERKQSIESKFVFGRPTPTIPPAHVTSGVEEEDHATVAEGGNETAGIVYVALNRVVAGNFRSGSGLCRVLVSLFSDDADRCSEAQNQCHADAICYNVTKSYRCKCRPGFHGNGRTCLDVNECEKENGGCVHLCHNSHGSYRCTCFDGFRLDTSSGAQNCLDVNECAVNNGGCEHECVNSIGNFECRCRPGHFMAGNGKNCISGSNWCREQFGCSHHCHSTALGIKCVCRRGYRLLTSGKDCVPTCALGNGGCHHRCTDHSDGAMCSCHDKYTLRKDRRTCTASCALNNGGCARRCEDSVDGPVCSCPPGFLLDEHDNKTCHDVNECSAADRAGCSHTCSNTDGGYECLCPTGYRLSPDLKTCRDIDECSWNQTCDHVCTNTDGSHTCHCHHGYELYGGTHCADVDECAMNNGGCEHKCENTLGSYRCECHPGYRLHPNKRDCVEAVRCPPLRAPAKTTLDCKSRPGPTGSEGIVCELSCRGTSLFVATMIGTNATTVTSCGAQTGFQWSHELQNTSLLSCSEHVLAPGYKGRAKFMFFADHCRVRRKNLVDFERQLSPILVGDPDSCQNDACSVTFVDLKCDTRKRYFRHLAGNRMHTLMSAEFEMNVKPANPTDKCGVDCAREKNLKRFRRSLKRLRAMINNNREKFAIQYEGKNYEVLKKSLRAYKPKDVCEPGQVLSNKICVACSLATWYSPVTGTCEPCPAGTYQDTEGQLTCKSCPHRLYGVGVEGAKSIAECGEICSPGTYSSDGLTPCRPCPIGTYQSDYGRTLCLQCGPGILTRSPRATGFQECLVAERCRPGEYYSSSEERCVACPRDSYQPLAGQNFCVDCPGDTQTDAEGAIDSAQCKDRTCHGETTGLMGYIQSPNWPGQYPANIECTWQITPEHGRRILFVVPEIHLAAQDHCRDSLVMRKTASPYSLTTFETCSSSSTPVAFTARSHTLWIYFKTDAVNSAKGFSIPYVTYSAEYQELIDDIVRDGRLYVPHQHQEVLKDAKLLSAIMEVIAQPYNYFKYANASQTMFPESFVRLLRSKVVKFFS